MQDLLFLSLKSLCCLHLQVRLQSFYNKRDDKMYYKYNAVDMVWTLLLLFSRVKLCLENVKLQSETFMNNHLFRRNEKKKSPPRPRVGTFKSNVLEVLMYFIVWKADLSFLRK